jgi:hypothetical protein
MTRKFIQFIFLALMLLTLAASGRPVQSQAPLVGVRIPAEASGEGLRVDVPGEVVIDYGSFTWAVMSQADLVNFDNAGATYQAYPNPYALTLG